MSSLPFPLRKVVPAPDRTVATVVTGPTVQVLRGAHWFDTLRDDWQAAVDRMARPSVFITPTVVQLAWEHLHQPGDEPWFVVLREGDVLVGLLPLVLTRVRHARLPLRALRHMGMLAGDRPGLVHTLAADRVWQLASQALLAHRTAWQLLDLQELDAGSWPLRDADAGSLWRRHGLAATTQVDTHAGHLPIVGTWEAYLQARSRNTRQGFTRRERQLREACPDLRIEVVDRPEAIAAAFDRYLAIEARGWKRREAIGLWSDPREPGFHRALLPALARHGQASVWLLHTGTTDIAGLVRLRHGRIVYERHSTFCPDWARYSPSTYLCMQAVRALFGTDCDESDVLGMPQPLAERPAISAWYPGERTTYRLQVLNAPLHYRPLLWLHGAARRLRAAWRRTPDDHPARARPTAPATP